jgi:hypothetical protein
LNAHYDRENRDREYQAAIHGAKTKKQDNVDPLEAARQRVLSKITGYDASDIVLSSGTKADGGVKIGKDFGHKVLDQRIK